ncbi:CBS domain-containing protein [Streptomyces caeni]|uniref:CBS domain-containing protein n=1 Tax=Streptomyces caeni TaxID=2307231 RepID=A0ABW4IYX9_9ACTN
MQSRHSTLVLTDFEGHPSGLLHLPRLATIPTPQRETLRLRDVALPRSRCATCAPEDPVEGVLEGLSPGSGLPVLVCDGQHVAGVITATDIARVVQRHALRGSKKQ